MRQFLRRVGAAFCLTFALFALTACGSSGSADETMSAQDQTFVMQMAESTLRTLDAMTDEELALTLNYLLAGCQGGCGGIGFHRFHYAESDR